MNEKVNVKVEICGINEVIEKAEEYVKLLEKAKTLADELASTEIALTVLSQQ